MSVSQFARLSSHAISSGEIVLVNEAVVFIPLEIGRGNISLLVAYFITIDNVGLHKMFLNPSFAISNGIHMCNDTHNHTYTSTSGAERKRYQRNACETYTSYSVVIPIERAVPAIIFFACVMSFAFKSSIFSFAMPSSC